MTDPSAAGRQLSKYPARHLAVVTCMDARLDVFDSMGIALGDAHIIRNAGGIVTQDVLRSLVISQLRLKTNVIAVVQHTECGLLGMDEAEFMADLKQKTGTSIGFGLGAFSDLDKSVRDSIQTLQQCRFLPHRNRISGHVHEIGSGRLRSVSPLASPGPDLGG